MPRLTMRTPHHALCFGSERQERRWPCLLPTALIAALAIAPSAAASAPAPPPRNAFGIGVYGQGGGVAGPSLAEQLPWARSLAGEGGSVLLYMNLLFGENGDASSCTGGCAPAAEDAAALRQAYALGLRPVVRLGQWPRTIRDFSDDGSRRRFTALGEAYRRFASALPMPPGGGLLDVVVLNEPNVCGEWACRGPTGTKIHPLNRTAPEVASCLRDVLAALRALPRLRLSAAPTAYTAPSSCSCDGSPDPVPDWTVPTDIAFMAAMLREVPGLYEGVDFFNCHPYPFGNQPFSTALGRAGSVHYRAQLNATGLPPGRVAMMEVLITEAGWRTDDEASQAASVTAAYKEEWLPDQRVAAVMPFLLSAGNGSAFEDGWPWVQWAQGRPPNFTAQFNATRALRCGMGVGGPC